MVQPIEPVDRAVDVDRKGVDRVRVGRLDPESDPPHVRCWKPGPGLAPARATVLRMKDAGRCSALAPSGTEEPRHASARSDNHTRVDTVSSALLPLELAARLWDALVETQRRSTDGVLSIARIDGHSKEGLASQVGRAGLRNPGGAGVVGSDNADSTIGRERAGDAKPEQLERVALARPDIDAARIGWVDRQRAAHEARAGEARRVQVEAIHERAPRRAAVGRPEHAAIRGRGVDDVASGRDRQPSHPSRHWLTTDRLPVENDARPERQPVACAGDERRGRRDTRRSPRGCGGRGRDCCRLAALELEEDVAPVGATCRGEHSGGLKAADFHRHAGGWRRATRRQLTVTRFESRQEPAHRPTLVQLPYDRSRLCR